MSTYQPVLSVEDDFAFTSHTFQGSAPGPRLIVLGSVHGNETCGTQAILRFMDELARQQVSLVAGTLTVVPIVNRRAYRLNQRGADRNLNRQLGHFSQPQYYEDHVANWLCPLLQQNDVLLDLHSFHTPGLPFVLIGPQDNQGGLEPFAHAAKEEAFAKILGVYQGLEGWLSTYALGVERRKAAFAHMAALPAGVDTEVSYGVGTTEYMRQQGGWGVTLECGQHEDPSAPGVAYQAMINTLAHLGMIEAPLPDAISNITSLCLYDVVDKLDDNDAFGQHFASFDPVPQGQLIGTRANGERIVAQEDSYMVFPNPAARAGEEWFYLARASSRLK